LANKVSIDEVRNGRGGGTKGTRRGRNWFLWAAQEKGSTWNSLHSQPM